MAQYAEAILALNGDETQTKEVYLLIKKQPQINLWLLYFNLYQLWHRVTICPIVTQPHLNIHC